MDLLQDSKTANRTKDKSWNYYHKICSSKLIKLSKNKPNYLGFKCTKTLPKTYSRWTFNLITSSRISPRLLLSNSQGWWQTRILGQCFSRLNSFSYSQKSPRQSLNTSKWTSSSRFNSFSCIKARSKGKWPPLSSKCLRTCFQVFTTKGSWSRMTCFKKCSQWYLHSPKTKKKLIIIHYINKTFLDKIEVLKW